MKTLWPLPVGWAIHLLLWVAWPMYQYAYKIPLPDFFVDMALKAFHYHQIEDLPDARRYAWLVAGFIVWSVVAIVVIIVLKARARSLKPSPFP